MLIFETLHGSHAYGLAREGSDIDIKGVVLGPPSWYFGLAPGPEQVDLSADHVHYELRKFARLLARSNPSVLEVLFADSRDHRVVTPEGERLLTLKDHVLSREVARTFAGYARGQLAKIRSHRRWLLEPPNAAPSRVDFGLPEEGAWSPAELGAAEALDGPAPRSFSERLAREKRFRSAWRTWRQYLQWKRERNPKRAALEAAFGYDTKHAMHMMRLLRMALEIVASGEVLVRRPDREELLAIRDGALSYDGLVEAADDIMTRLDAAVSTSALPESPDVDAIERVVVSLLTESLRCP